MKLLNILIFLLIFNSLILTGFLVSNYTGNAVLNNIEHANLTRVVDGDTIETNLGKVRMLGINTPEKNQAGYEEAKSYLKQYEGKQIELERTNEDKDMYDRKLRYVFFSGININKKILELGLASLYVYDKDKYYSELTKAEESARKKELGIWEKSTTICSVCIKLDKLNSVDPGEYVILENSCDFECNLNDWNIKDDARHTKKLDFTLPENSQIQINYTGSVWNDAGDSFYLRDNSGLLVVFYRY